MINFVGPNIDPGNVNQVKFDDVDGGLNLHGYHSTMRINNQRADTSSSPNALSKLYDIF